MEKYVCSVCGFVYDEAKGIPESGIALGSRWEDLPEDWVCPICGATKAEFEKQGESAAPAEKKSKPVIDVSTDMQQLSSLEISALCTNLARGCEKQYKPEEAALFNELAGYFKTASVPAKDPDFNKLIALIEKDLEEGFEDEFTIVGPAESSPAEGRISHESCVGEALMGRKVGDKVTVQAPGGSIKYEIVSVQ